MGLFSSIVDIFTGNSARRDRNNAAKDRERINEIRNIQARRAFIQQFRRAQADALSSAAASGLGGVGAESSRVQGAQSSLRTQAGLGIFENLLQERLGQTANKLERDAARTELVGGAVSNLVALAENDLSKDSSTLRSIGRGIATAITPAPTGAISAQGSTSGFGPLRAPAGGRSSDVFDEALRNSNRSLFIDD